MAIRRTEKTEPVKGAAPTKGSAKAPKALVQLSNKVKHVATAPLNDVKAAAFKKVRVPTAQPVPNAPKHEIKKTKKAFKETESRLAALPKSGKKS